MKTTARPIKILLIDDDRSLADTARYKLETAGLRATLESAINLQSALSRMEKKHFDIIVLNPFFGPVQGQEAYLAIRKRAWDVPILLMVPAHQEADALNLVDLGADDYVLKETTRPAMLWHAARAVIKRCVLKQRLNTLESVAKQSSTKIPSGEIKEGAAVRARAADQTARLKPLTSGKPQNLKNFARSLEATVSQSSLQALPSAKPTSPKVPNKRGDGSEFWTARKVLTLGNLEKALKNFVLIQRDGSEEQSSQSPLQQISLLKQQQDFVTAIAHDFKSPMLGAIWATELIRDGRLGPLTAEQSTVIEGLQSSQRQLLRLATNMIELYAKQDRNVRPSPVSFQLADLIQECAFAAMPLARANGLRIVTDIKLNFKEYYDDQDALRLLIANLLDNAVAFSPSGAVVSLVVRSIGKEIVIRVIDQGPGLSEEQQSLISDCIWPQTQNPRYTAATALGLFVSNKIVNAYGGSMRCLSSSIDETVWEVALPLVHESNLQ
jgi:signal transduction histidine kinase